MQVKQWRLTKVTLHRLEDNSDAIYKTVDGTSVPIDNLSGLDSFIAVIKSAFFSYQDQIVDCYPTGQTIMLPHWLAVKYMDSINIINTKFETLQHTESLIKATYPVLFTLIVVVYLFNAIKALFALFSDSSLTAFETLFGKITGQDNYRASKFRTFSRNLAEQSKELISVDRPEGKTKVFVNIMNILYQIRSRIPRFLIGALFSRIVALTMTHLSLKDSIVRDYEKINRDMLEYYSTAIVTPQNKASCQYIEDLLLNTCGNLKGFLWIVYDKGPLEKIIIVGVVTFVLTFAAAKLATFLVLTAGRIGTIGSDIVDRELDRFSQSQALTGFDNVLDPNQTLPTNQTGANNNTNQTIPNNNTNQTIPTNQNDVNAPFHLGENFREREIPILRPRPRPNPDPNPPIVIDERDAVDLQNEATRLANVDERGPIAEYEPAVSQNGGFDLRRAADLANEQRDTAVLEAFRLVPQPRAKGIMERLKELILGGEFDDDPRVRESKQIITNHTRKVLTKSRLEREAFQRETTRVENVTTIDDTHSIVPTNIFGNF